MIYQRLSRNHLSWLRVLFVTVLLMAQGGCAAVALTAGGLAAGVGVNHTLNGIVYKTFNKPVGEVHTATLKALNDLDMGVKTDDGSKEGRQIQAAAVDREIEISLERLSNKATRMRVEVDEGGVFFKDSATATEIIVMTAEKMGG